MIKLFVPLFILSLSVNVNANNVTNLASNGVQKWNHKVFVGSTDYSVIKHKGKLALKAVSKGTSSGLFLKKKIDLQKTPILNWNWLVEQSMPELNERSKAGDDFVARVYLVIDGGLAKWKSKSVNYVWSGSQSKGQVWDNPYLGNKVKMVALRGKDDKTGQWLNEKRNVYQDLIKHFGDKGSPKANLKAYRYVHAVAIMTDADNSKSNVEAYYGDVIFSSK